MSGYDRRTGWCHFTPKKWQRYYRERPGEPDDVGERCAKAGIAYYADHAGGIHAQCGEGALWTLLSGEPSDWDSEPPASNADPEYLTVTDIGVNLSPALSAIKTNRAIVVSGLQDRVDGVWVPTPKGLEYCIEIDSEDTRYGNKTYLKWSFETIEILKQQQE